MALKNATNYRVTSRDFEEACRAGNFAAEDVKSSIEFIGLEGNKIKANVNIELKINGYECLLTGTPLISLNHFELKLTGNSARLSPEEAERIKKKIELLQMKLQNGEIVTDEELNGE